MKLEYGRPTDTSGREEKEIRVYDLLDKCRAEYWRIDHEPVDTMELCAGIDEALGVSMCKNLFLCNRPKTEFYLLLLPGHKKLKTSDLSKKIGSSRLGFADAENMQKYLDITPGSVSIMGLMNDTQNAVTLLVDEDILQGEYIGCHPCVNTSSLKLKTADVFGKVLSAMGHTMTVVNI